MRRTPPRLSLLLVLLALAAPRAAEARHSIHLYAPEPASDTAADGPPIAVTFEDARLPEEGGDEPELLGKVRTNVGIPFGLWADGPGVEDVIPDLVEDALHRAGLPVEPRGADGARLHVVLLRSWCTGWQVYKVHVQLELQLFAPDSAEPTWAGIFEGRAKGPIVFTPRELEVPYATALERLLEALVPALDGEEFATAARPEAPPLASWQPATVTRAAEPASASASGATLGRDWERVSLLLGAWVTPPVCERYVGRDDWTGQWCRGRLRLGTRVILRPTDQFMVYLGANGGFGWETDIRVIHDLADVDRPESTMEGQLRASFGAGAALPVPRGELRLGGGMRWKVNRLDPAIVRRFEKEYEIRFDRTGSVGLAGELRFELDGEPAPQVRLGPRFAFRVGDEVAILYADIATDEERERAEAFAAGPSFSFLPSFAISFPGAAVGALYLEFLPSVRLHVRPAAAQEALRESYWIEQPQPVVFHGAFYIVIGGELRLGRPGQG